MVGKCVAVGLAFVLACTASVARAADGTWTRTTAGPFNWNDIANWNNGAGPVADGADFTAFFTPNITANQIVNLSAPQTIGNITFTDSGTSSNNLTISGANILTLDVTTGLPTIDVTQSARTLTISSQIAGNDGLLKTGAGTLTLSNTGNTYSGGTFINAGVLTYTSNGSLGAAGTRNITFGGSATLTGFDGSSLGSITVNSGTASITAANYTFTSAAGAGAINFSTASGSKNLNLGNADALDGNLRLIYSGNLNNGGNVLLQFSDLGDAVGSKLQFSSGQSDSNQGGAIALSGDAGPLVFDNRQIEILARTASNWILRDNIIANNNSNAANTWIINTNLSYLENTSRNFILSGSNAGNNAFNGVISNGSGTINFAKTGNGKWILSNTNTYSGTTTLTGGILNATSTDALGNSAATNTLIFNGGTLQAGGTITSAASRNVTMTATGVIDTNGNAVSIAGVVSGAGGLTKSGAGTLTLSGGITYAGATTINAGTLSIGDGGGSGAVSATGAITNNGTLVFNRSNTLVQGVTFGSVISGSGSLNQAGAGTTILSGSNTYTGNTTISAGTISARHANALGTGGTRNVSVSAGAALNYAAAADAPLSITGTLGITGGAGTFIGGSIGSTATGARIAVTGDATATGAIGVNIHGITGVTPLAGTNTYTLVSGVGGGSAMNSATYSLGNVYNNTNFTVGALSSTAADLNVEITDATPLTGAFWTGGLAGATNVWAASDGSANSNWVTAAGGGATPLVPGSGADVNISANTVTTAPTATMLGANMSIRSLTISDTTNGLGLTDDGSILTIANAAGITMNTSVPASSIAARVALGANQTWTNNSSNDLTISGAVSGAFGLTTAGTGTIALSGVNTYSGGTTVTAGTLNLIGSVAGAATVNGGTLFLNNTTTNGFTNSTTVNSGGTLTLGAANRIVDTAVITVNNGGTFDLNGFAETIQRTTGTGGTVTNTGAVATLTLTGAGTQTISNVFDGALNLSIQGNSIITLTGSNNYTGSTTIGTSGSSGPRLTLGGNNVLPSTTAVSGNGNSAAGTVLDLNGFNQTVASVTLSNSNGGAQTAVGGSGSSTLTLNGNVTVLSANNGAGAITTSFLDLNGGTRTFSTQGNNASNFLSVSSVIQNGSLIVTGGGTSASVRLLGANTYSGTTRVNSGFLRLDNLLALQNSPVDTAGAGVINLNAGAGTYSLGGLIGSKNLSSVITTNLANMTTLNLNPQAGTDVSYSGVIANGTMGLTKTGAGTQTLTNAVHTYTGATIVSNGVLAISGTGSINSSSGVTINGGTLAYNSSVALTAPLTFTSGTLGGTNWTGAQLNNLTINAGRTISPGNSPGTASTVDQTWASGGNYTWEINSGNGTVGTDPGWDLLSGTGTLTLTANSSAQFNILVTSLQLDNSPGNAANFDDTLDYEWLIADFANDVTTFDATAFNINLTAFSNSYNGTWGIARGDSPGISGGDASQIYLTYIAVPEPAGLALAGLGIAGITYVIRRRGRALN